MHAVQDSTIYLASLVALVLGDEDEKLPKTRFTLEFSDHRITRPGWHGVLVHCTCGLNNYKDTKP